jgi:hypothetical protein
MHFSMPDEMRPIVFEKGVRVPFPSATKEIPKPELRQKSKKLDSRERACWADMCDDDADLGEFSDNFNRSTRMPSAPPSDVGTVAESLSPVRMGRQATSPSMTKNATDAMTTVILRNVPIPYTRAMLLDLMDSEGFFACYDFVYLPLKLRKHISFGYAVVNLINEAEHGASTSISWASQHGAWRVAALLSSNLARITKATRSKSLTTGTVA